MPISQHFNSEAFDPVDIHAMSIALDDVCKVLKLPMDGPERETMATRIVDLARRGERDPNKLSARVLREATDPIRFLFD